MVASSFKKVRDGMWTHPDGDVKRNISVAAGSNGSASTNFSVPVAVDHIGVFDRVFRDWIPKVKKDLELISIMLSKLGTDLGGEALSVARDSGTLLRRVPIHYGRLRKKITHAFARATHEDHDALHQDKMIQSECGVPYTMEQFIAMFDHDHNLALTEEESWTDDFKEEFYTGWPVFANQMRLHDPACGSRKWSITSEAELKAKERAAKKAKEEAERKARLERSAKLERDHEDL